MTTAVTLLNQLAELWPMIDRDDPALVEAEAAFAAAVAKVMREPDPAAERMMLGTAEACDALAQDAERRAMAAERKTDPVEP